MSTTLARRIRRMDLLPSSYDEKRVRTHNYYGTDPGILLEQTGQLRAEAKERRIVARAAKRKARAAHRSRVANLHKKKA